MVNCEWLIVNCFGKEEMMAKGDDIEERLMAFAVMVIVVTR
jgi:hypothetical protein